MKRLAALFDDSTRLQILVDCKRGLETLLSNKVRSFLTMLGMIFGVAAVVSMMSIGAGAQQQVLAVHRAAWRAQPDRRGEGSQRLHGVPEGAESVARPDRARPSNDSRERARHHGVFGAQALRAAEARAEAAARGAADVWRRAELPGHRRALGRVGALLHSGGSRRRRACRRDRRRRRTNLFGAKDPIGEYVKVNEQWFRVIGMVGPQVSSQTDVAGIPAQDRNNLIYVPVAAAILRRRRQLQPLQGRDRRHLPADGGRRRDGAHGGCRARHPQCVAPRRGRLLAGRPGGAAGRTAAHAAHLWVRDGGAGVDLAAGGRHRHHEHHAGQRPRAHARDRHPPRHRRQADRHRPAVPGRDDHDRRLRRGHRAGRRRGPLAHDCSACGLGRPS